MIPTCFPETPTSGENVLLLFFKQQIRFKIKKTVLRDLKVSYTIKTTKAKPSGTT